ncbi:MAG: hypothetical protein O6934_12575 [SAR324 cluster bacterium]|nr:hypothetical protein [SAR324 cluster bacterium]MCZ6644983.1 hypothetical protein [SAR324 cluster bacterium]
MKNGLGNWARWALLAGLVGLLLAGAPLMLAASPSDIQQVRFTRSAGQWRVDVTIRHADTGWEHYTNVWVVETMEGKLLGKRVLYHPHVSEQPFTRSHTVTIPRGISKVRVRAGDNVDGISSNTVMVDLTQESGDRFQVSGNR